MSTFRRDPLANHLKLVLRLSAKNTIARSHFLDKCINYKITEHDDAIVEFFGETRLETFFVFLFNVAISQ